MLPKGSFVIRDGSITVKILDRIPIEDTSFGTAYKDRTKAISGFYRLAFDSLRKEIEGETYFHSVVKQDFRYKGDVLYSSVVSDLKENKTTYKNALDLIDKKCTIVNLSGGNGQLDFLLLLDSADRKICTFIENEISRDIAANSFITAHYNRLVFATSKEDALKHPTDFIILKTSEKERFEAENLGDNKFLNFQVLFENQNLAIFKQKTNI